MILNVEIDTEQNSKDEVLYSVGNIDNCHKSNTMLRIRTRLRFILVVESSFLKVSQGNFVTCTICETVMTALDESIVDPNNEQVKGLLAKTFIWFIFSFYFPGSGRLSGSDL